MVLELYLLMSPLINKMNYLSVFYYDKENTEWPIIVHSNDIVYNYIKN